MPPPIRILRVLSRLMVGGPVQHARILSTRLGPEFETLLVGGPPEPGEEAMYDDLVKAGARVVLIPSLRRDPGVWRDLASVRSLTRICREFKPEIVHTHTAKAGAVGRIAAWRAHVPVRVHTFHGHVFHGYFGPVTNAFFIRVERTLARISTRIITITPRQRADIVEKYRIAAAAKVEMIPLGLELERFADVAQHRGALRKELAAGEKDLLIGIIGRLAPVKNHDMLIDAAKILLDSGRIGEARFVVAGDGALRPALEARARGIGLGEKFRFIGLRKDLERLYADMDLVVLTSKNEGSPVALIEAQSAGVPVISTDVGGVSDVVAPGAGVVTPAGDARAFADALAAFIAEPGPLKRGAEANREATRRKFSAERLVEDIRGLYMRLLEERIQGREEFIR
jgi:glycosyltransferase involved in cell wall biosynthesis